MIRQKGVADKLFYIPIKASERSDLLPSFGHITIEGKCTDWSNANYNHSLRWFTTVPLVLLAGCVSEKIHFHLLDDEFLEKSEVVRQAWWPGRGYAVEMGGDNLPLKEADKAADELLQHHLKFVAGVLSKYWEWVEKLADKLLKHKTLSESAVFTMMGKCDNWKFKLSRIFNSL